MSNSPSLSPSTRINWIISTAGVPYPIKLDEQSITIGNEVAHNVAPLKNRMLVRELTSAIRFEPSNGSHYCKRAYIHAANGKLDAMRADFEKAIALRPENRRVWQQRAWLLATSTDDQHRNGPQAVLDATKACELAYWSDTESLDQLATAYAETGEFAQAIQWQEKAVALTPIAKRPQLDARLQLYKQHKPYREPLIRVQPAT